MKIQMKLVLLRVAFAILFLILALMTVSVMGDDLAEDVDPPALPLPPNPCTVRVIVEDADGTSKGSGAYIGTNIVATANHVVIDRASDRVKVRFPRGIREGSVTFTNKANDIAIITLDGCDDGCDGGCKKGPTPLVPALILNDGVTLTIEGWGKIGVFRRDSGTLSSKRYGRKGDYRWLMIEGCTARQGDSGGPVYTLDGKFAGTLWGSVKGETYFTPVDKLLKMADLKIDVNIPPYDIIDPEEADDPVAPPYDISDEPTEDQVSGRYHNRSRTRNFFKRSTKTKKVRKVRKVKATA